ncbi:Chloroperoxidase, partial [Flagelloscypha sp. PMI_526]
KRCPVTGQEGETHEWRAASPTDIRSVCPALNTLAAHGYISRDGKNLSSLQIAYGLKACYGLSTGLALFLSFGGVFLIRGPFKFVFLGALHTINRHFDVTFFGVEHDASLVHRDTPRQRPVHPPNLSPSKFLSSVKGNSITPEDPRLVDHATVAKWRIRREKESPPLDAMHAEIARGEMGIILGVWDHQDPQTGAHGIPAGWLKNWFKDNRLPDGWSPDHIQELLDVVKRSKAIKAEMEKIRASQ